MKIQIASRKNGFTFIELCVVVAVIGLLAAMSIPYMARARDNSRLNVIYRNLRALDNAKDEWALDNKKPEGATIADVAVLSDYLHGGDLRAVVRETYVPNSVGQRPEADLPATVALGPFGPGAIIPAL